MTAAQMRELGLDKHWVRYRVEVGQLIRAYHGVYAVGHVPTEPRARAFGAQLAAGDGAGLAGASAAAFYGVFRRWEQPFELLGPTRRRCDGLVLRRSATLKARDIWTFDGLRVTSPARTSLDLAPRMTEKQLKRAVDHLRLRNGLNLHLLRDIIERNPRHPGATRLRRVIGQSSRTPSRSGFEREWPAFARRFMLPSYETNVKVAGVEVDVLVDGAVIVELDTMQTHLLNFASDRERDAEILATTGIPTIRVTADQFREKPERLAERILRVLATSAARAA